MVSALNRDLWWTPGKPLPGRDDSNGCGHQPGQFRGPLIDYRGQVIGVTTAIIEQAQGIGFAIPSSTAKAIGDQIISHGRPLRLGVLGFSDTRPGPEHPGADRYGAGRGAGRLYHQGAAGHPGRGRWFGPGDVITAVNGQEIAGMRELRDAVQQGDSAESSNWPSTGGQPAAGGSYVIGKSS